MEYLLFSEYKERGVDCASCDGICCVSLEIDDDKFRKKAGVPCLYLNRRNGKCRIYEVELSFLGVQIISRPNLCKQWTCHGAGPFLFDLMSILFKKLDHEYKGRLYVRDTQVAKLIDGLFIKLLLLFYYYPDDVDYINQRMKRMQEETHVLLQKMITIKPGLIAKIIKDLDSLRMELLRKKRDN